MVRYKFSARERVLIGVFVAIIALLAWFMLVYQPTTLQISQIEGDIAEGETQISVAATQVSQLNQMKADIEAKKAAGVEPSEVPEYDNVRPLMAQLNAVMAAADTYTLSFEDISRADGNVLRPVRIDFGCGSYQAAEAVVSALANGPYPCAVDAVSIVDKNARTSGTGTQAGTGASASAASGDSAFGAYVHVIFFEREV